MIRTILFPCILFSTIVMAWNGYAAAPVFVPIKVDGPAHDPANGTFWYGPFSEPHTIFDLDNDGYLDITCGENWYRGPDWIKQEGYRDGAPVSGEFVNNCAEYAIDVNGDGLRDIVSATWFGNCVFWHENPGRTGVKWEQHRIIDSRSTEGLFPADLDGDGDLDILVNHWENEPGQELTWIEIVGDGTFNIHTLGSEADVHGGGAGDVNGDGRMDIVTPYGWYEGPVRPREDSWEFHPDYHVEHVGIPMLVHDVDRDGLNDIIFGHAHDYGLGWMEQGANGTWETHWIETGFAQFHTMLLADVNDDGSPDLITGKRLRGHNGDDAGSYDPLFIFWYDIDGGAFNRHVISYNHMPWYPSMPFDTPPPNYAVGTGMCISFTDVTRDGRKDIVCAGKSGLYILVNRGVPPTEPLDRR